MAFEGFELEWIEVGNCTLRVRHGGSGPPVVLLHGHPRTHMTWNMVAPMLAADFTVVCPDLRGYGRSSSPPSEDDRTFSKRAMAGDVVNVMEHLGFTEFAVVGHDRGAYVAHRLAVDHDETKGLVMMDAVPIWEALERCNRHFAAAWWHWFFLGQRDKPAERIINADPEGWYQITPNHMGDEAFADLRQALHDPTVIHAMCEDYRAGLRIDRDDEEADRQNRRFTTCPALVMWAEFDDMEELYGDPVEVWRPWLPDLRGGERIPSGHHMAEEAPGETAAVIHTFLREVI